MHPRLPSRTMRRADRTEIAPECRSLLRAQTLDSVEAVYARTDGRVFAHSGTTEVRRIELADGPRPRILFLKKYSFPTAAERWRGALRGTFLVRSKVRREFDNLTRLRAWGFDAPAPVAWGEERIAGWLARSFLISEEVPEPLPLHRFIRDVLPTRAPEEQRALRAGLIRRVAELTRRLHERRFVHHDLFWRNIILSGSDFTRLFLIDAHKGRVWRAGSEDRSRAADLAALDAPAPQFFRRAERLRFFLLYLGRARLTVEDRTLLRATLRAAAPMRERQLRRLGPPRACIARSSLFAGR